MDYSDLNIKVVNSNNGGGSNEYINIYLLKKADEHMFGKLLEN